MARAKPDKVVVHRIELQDTERAALEAATMAYVVGKSGSGIGSVVSAFTQMTPAGAIMWGSIVALLAVELGGRGTAGGISSFFQEIDPSGQTAEQPYHGPREGESPAEVRARSTFGQRMKYNFIDKPMSDFARLKDLF